MLAANLGVIAGIIFLAIEIQQNNEILQDQSRLSVLENQKDWTFFLAGSDENISLLYGSLNSEELTEVQKLRRENLIGGMMATWRWEFEQLGRERIGFDQLPVEAYRFYFKQVAINPEEWDVQKSKAPPEDAFIHFIEENVANY